MTDTQHTLGPLVAVQDADGYAIMHPKKACVGCRIHSAEYARLFAAAPDLLEALEDLIDCRWVADTVSPEVDRAVAAINKARGIGQNVDTTA